MGLKKEIIIVHMSLIQVLPLFSHLADLDDITGNVMTLVTSTQEEEQKDYGSNNKNESSVATSAKLSSAELEAESQKIIRDAVRDVESKLQALARGERQQQESRNNRMSSITGALLLSTALKRNKPSSDEETPLVK